MHLLPKILARLNDLAYSKLAYIAGLIGLPYNFDMYRETLLAQVSAKLKTCFGEILLKCWDCLENNNKEEGRLMVYDEEHDVWKIAGPTLWAGPTPWQKWIDQYLEKEGDLIVPWEVELLHKAREDITASDHYLFTWACARGHTDFVNILLDVPEIDITVHQCVGFRDACSFNHTEIIERLLKDDRIQSALAKGDLPREILDKYGPKKVEPEPWQKWIDEQLAHPEKLPVDLLDDLEHCRENVNYKDNILFWWACRNYYVDLAKMLLDVPGGNITKDRLGSLCNLWKKKDLSNQVIYVPGYI